MMLELFLHGLDADIQGIRQDAPEGFVARKATGIARSVVDIGLQGSLAALGGTTLPEKVSSYNDLLKQREFAKDDSTLKDRLKLGIKGKETQDLLNKSKVPAQGAITQQEIDQYRAGTLSSDNPKFAILQQLDASAKESKQSFDKFTKVAEDIKEELPYNMRDQALAREAYQVVAEHEGNWAAAWHTATNHLDILLSQGIDSTPWMVAFTIGGPFAQTMILADLAKGRGREAIEEFRTKYGKEPTMEEASRIKMWSAIGTVAEKFGDMAAVGLLGKRIPWITRVIDTAAKSTTAKIAGLVTLKIPGSLGGEAISGASTAASEQMASEGKITDTIAIGYDALAEAAGTPGGIATMYAGKAAIEAAKLPFKPSALQQKIIDLDERIDKVKSTTISDLDDPAFHKQLQEGAEAKELNEKLAIAEEVIEKLEDPTPIGDTDKNFRDTQIDDFTTEFLEESRESKTETGDQISLFEEQEAREKAEATLEKEADKLKKEIKDIKARLDTKLTEKEQSNYVQLLEKIKEAILTKEKKQKTLKTKEGKEARIKEIDEEIDKIRNTPGFTGREVKQLLDEKDTLQKELDPFTTRIKRVFKTEPSKQEELSYESMEDSEFRKFVKSIDLKKITNPDTDPTEVSKVIDSIAQLQKTKELTSIQESILTKITDKILGTKPRTEGDTLGSIRNVTTKSETLLRNALKTAKKDKNEADEALITAELDRRAQEKKLKALDKAEGKKRKTLQEVHTDIEEGVSTRWTGINTYYDRIVEIVAAAKDTVLDKAAVSNQLSRMKTHVDNLRKKRDKFQSAFKKGPRADGKIYVIRGTVGENREMTYTEEVMTRQEYLTARKSTKNYVNAIITDGTQGFTYNSSKLIEKVEAEVAYGEKFLEVLVGFEETSYERAEAKLRNERENLRKKKEQLSKSKFKKKKALILDKETRDKIESKTDDELRAYIKEQREVLKTVKAKKDETEILKTEALITHASLQWNKRQQDKKKKDKKGKKKDPVKRKTKAKTAKGKQGTKTLTKADIKILREYKWKPFDPGPDEVPTSLFSDAEIESYIKDPSQIQKDIASLTPLASLKPDWEKRRLENIKNDTLAVDIDKAIEKIEVLNSLSVMQDKKKQDQKDKKEKQESVLAKEIEEELKKITLDNALEYLQELQEIVEKFNERADGIPISFRGIEFDEKRVVVTIYEYIVKEMDTQFANLYASEITEPSISYETLVAGLQDMQNNLFDITENFGAYTYYSKKWKVYYGLLSQNAKRTYLESIGKTELQQLTKEEKAKYAQLDELAVTIPKSPTGVFSRTIDLAMEAKESSTKRLSDPRTDLQKSQEVLTKGIVERFGNVWTAVDWLIKNSTSKRTRLIASFVKRTLPKKGIDVISFPLYFHNKFLLPAHSGLRGAAGTAQAGTVEIITYEEMDENGETITKQEEIRTGTEISIAISGLTERTVLHELIHAAVGHNFRNPVSTSQKAAVKQLKYIAEALRAMLDGYAKDKTLPAMYSKEVRDNFQLSSSVIFYLNYAAGRIPGADGKYVLGEKVSIEELITVALSNPDIQNLLKEMPALGKVETSLWSEFVQSVRRLLNIPEKNITLLDQVVQASEVLMEDRIDFTTDTSPITNLQEAITRFKDILHDSGFIKDIDWVNNFNEVASLNQLAKALGVLAEGDPNLVSPMETTSMTNAEKLVGVPSSKFTDLLNDTQKALNKFNKSKEGTTVFTSFIDQLQDRVKSIISLEELEKRKEKFVSGKTAGIASSLENHFDILGKFFYDLISTKAFQKGKTTFGSKKDLKVLKGINTLPVEAFQDEESLEDALVDLGVEKDSAKELAKEYSRFERKYSLIYKDATDPQGNTAINHPLRILYASYPELKEEVDIPPQIKFAMMVGTLDWINQNPTNIRFRKEFDRELFMYGGHANISRDERSELKYIGHDYTGAANSIGENINSLLRLFPGIDDAIAADVYHKNLIPALGMLALQVEHGPTDNSPTSLSTAKVKGIGKLKSSKIDQIWGNNKEDKPRFKIEEKTWNFKKKDKEGRKPKNGESYKHIKINLENKENEKDIPFKLPETLIAAQKDLTDTLKIELKGDSSKPAQKPFKEVATRVKGFLGGIPLTVDSMLRKLHKVSWTNTQALDIANILDQAGFRNVLYQLADVQHIDDDTNLIRKESLEASNADKINAVDGLLDAYNDSEGNLLKEFYFRYELQVQERIMQQSSGTINPQGSGVDRYYVRPKKGSVNYTKKKLWKFKLAVVASFGFKIDKNNLKAAVAAYDVLMEDQTILDAVNALQSINNSRRRDSTDTASISKVDTEYVEELARLLPIIHNKDIIGKPDHGSSILQGLQGLAEGVSLKSDIDDQNNAFIVPTLKTSFSSDIILEIDGISNGFAQNVFQFPMYAKNTLKRFSQTGTTIGAVDTYDPYQIDAYEDLGKASEKDEDGKKVNNADTAKKYYETNNFSLKINKWINKPFGIFNKNGGFDAAKYDAVNEALTRQYKPLAEGNTRKLLKYPFLIFMYGGGPSSIADGIASEIEAELYVSLEMLQREYNEQKGVDAQNEFIKTHVEVFLKDLITLEAATLTEAKSIQSKIQSNTSKEVEFSTKGADAIANVLLPRLDIALMSMLGGTKAARDSVIQAGELLHGVFLAHYNKAYDEMVTLKNENNEVILDTKGKPVKRPGLTEQEIEDLIELQLLEFFPQYKGPLMQEDGAFIDLTKRIRADIKNDAGRVSIDFNKVDNPNATATTTSKGIQFVAPGVSALIRLIINIDSSILTKTLANNPDVLPLHDAIMGSPDILEEASTDYNNFYLAINREFSVLDTIYLQLKNVIQNTKLKDKEDGSNLMGTIRTWTKNEAFVNKHKKTNKKKSFEALVAGIKKNSDEIEEARINLEGAIHDAEQTFPGGGIFSQQLYMPKPDSDEINESEESSSPASYSPILNPAIEHSLGDVPKPVNLDESSLLTDEQMEDIATSFEESLNSNPKANKALGSIKDRKKVNPIPTVTGDLTKKNVMSLFTDMVNASSNYYLSDADQNEHTTELESIISKIADKMTSAASVEFLQEEVDSITEGEFDPLTNKLTVSLSTKPPKGLNAQSPQEVYVHETVHALVTAALAKSPLLKRRIEKLYRQTKKETSERGGYRTIFLQSMPGGRKATLTEHKIAKRQYDYIFNNPENEQWRLDEFLAFAVTNRNLVKYLSGTKSKIHLQYRKEEKLFNRAIDVFTYFVEIATDIALRILGERGGFGASSKTEMIVILEKLLDIQGNHRNKLQILQDKVAQTADAGDTLIRTFAEQKVLNIMEEDPTTNKFKEAVRIATATGYYTLSKNAQTFHARQAVYETMSSVLRSLATEVGEGVLGKRLIQQLLQSKVKISKARQETERFTAEWFNGIWKSVDATKPKGMSVDLRRNLTSVIFKTDLSSLLAMGFSHTQIASFIGDRNKIKLEKAKIERQILNLKPVKNKNISWAVQYAEELGNHIVTGNTYLNLAHMNASTIATGYIANPTAQDLALLDAYATLTALGTLDDSKTSSVKSLVDNEFKINSTENGFIDLLDSHIQYVNKSYKDLFNSNHTQMVKGYIVERIDNLTDIKTGKLGQKKEMAADGYHEPYSLGPIPGISKSNDTLFIGRNVPPVPYVSAIMSTTNKRHMGTSLSDILAQDSEYQISPNEPNFKKIKQAIKQIHQAQLEEAKTTKLAKNPDITLRPVMDDKENITDFRVIMDHESKERLLDPDLEIQNVFAHMQSSYIDRKETLKNDLRTVELLVYEQEERLPSHPNEFINFLDPEEGFIDRYYRLPKEVRMYIDQFTKNGKFMIRKDAINKIFGYQASDLRNAFFLQHPSMRHVRRFAGLFHYMLRQIVGYGKDRIVIAMPQVWLYNAFSNISQLTMRNIPLGYTVYKIIEGFHEYEAYSKAIDERRRLLNQIAIKKLDRTRSPEAIQVRALDTQIVNNRIHRMSLWGLNSLIVEDLNDAALDGYATRAKRYLKANEWYNRNDKVPNIAGPIASSIFMMRNTGPYTLMRKIVQLTDFLARYVMIEHGMEVRGMDFDTIAHESLDAFVLFDEALHPALEALDATGTTVFMSYFLRNQRASRKLAMSNPTGVVTSGAFQYSTGIPTLGNLDSSFLVGDISPNVMYLDELFDEANNPTGYDLLTQYLGEIFN